MLSTIGTAGASRARTTPVWGRGPRAETRATAGIIKYTIVQLVFEQIRTGGDRNFGLSPRRPRRAGRRPDRPLLRTGGAGRAGRGAGTVGDARRQHARASRSHGGKRRGGASDRRRGGRAPRLPGRRRRPARRRRAPGDRAHWRSNACTCRATPPTTWSSTSRRTGCSSPGIWSSSARWAAPGPTRTRRRNGTASGASWTPSRTTPPSGRATTTACGPARQWRSRGERIRSCLCRDLEAFLELKREWPAFKARHGLK